MSTTAIIIAAGLATAQYPDALDHLRAGDVVPQVGLLLDRSCSMGWDARPTSCSHFASRYNGGSNWLDKKDQMKAILTGCESEDDGILDMWADRVDFSIFEFGSFVGLKTPFGSPLSLLEAGVLGIPASGSTYMTRGLREHGLYFKTFFTVANTLQCRPSFLVMLSDGNPNGGASTFNYNCDFPPESRYVSSWEPWRGSDYLYNSDDILCAVPGDQNIRTYTIGFGPPGSFSPSNLQNIATQGGGEYFYASDAQQLSNAFESVISSIVAKSALFFAPIAIQTGSMFAENFAYAASFKPAAGGPWRGTVKKYCVAPPLLKDGTYDKSVTTCLFISTADGRDLETNPTAMDLWTGVRSLAADEGGAGEVLFSKLESPAGGVPVAPYYSHRNIVSYHSGDAGFTAVNPWSWSPLDLLVNGCDYFRLMNYMHGYTFDANCLTGTPVALNEWPLGDPIGFAPQLIRYGKCEDKDGKAIEGNCFLASAMNDGMLHFFDAATGEETSALVPAELWGSNGYAHHTMKDILSQPSLSFTHRYYVDGGSRIFHEDANADGIIQKTEAAYLHFSLGRGGRAAYMIPINEMPDGELTASKNPVYPLLPQAGTALEDMQDMWAPPWLGLAAVDGTTKRVAVFASGHLPELDITDAEYGTAKKDDPVVPIDLSLAETVNCNGANGFADHNGLDKSSWCKSAWFPGCKGTISKPCYDSAGIPQDISSAPLTFNDGVSKAAAFRIEFDEFDLADDDELRIEDAKGNLIGSYSEDDLDKAKSPWIYGDAFVLRLVTDGFDTEARGFRIKKVEWVPGGPLPAAVVTPLVDVVDPLLGDTYELGVEHNPSVYIMDLDTWNGPTRRPFAANVTDDGMLVRFTNDCEGYASGRCYDRSDFADLDYMVCPISAEVSVFTENQHLAAIYVGDECGQIWKMSTDDLGKTWDARRLINLNSGKIGVSTDHRKIQRRIDIALSSCQGRRAVALYFGTGDNQRPGDKDNLMDPTITDGFELVGVLYDSPTLPKDLTQADLENVSKIPSVDPASLLKTNKHGWAVRLDKNERMLRDPLVFDRVAYYKTFEPTIEAAECGGGSGVDRIYAIDSCTASAIKDADGNGTRSVGEREVWLGETEIGGGLFFYTPKDGPVLVSHADLGKRQRAGLNVRKRTRPGLYFWRER